jgi:hypothetical protein
MLTLRDVPSPDPSGVLADADATADRSRAARVEIVVPGSVR